MGSRARRKEGRGRASGSSLFNYRTTSAELAELLKRPPLSDGSSPSERSVLVADMLQSTPASNFLIPYYLGTALKPQSDVQAQRVILLAADSTFEHYAQQARKLGLNLLEAHSSKLLTFFNLLSSPFQWSEQVQPLENQFTSVSEENVIQINTASSQPLKPLYTKVEGLLEKFSTAGNFAGALIVVDSLNSLALSLKSETEIVDFAQYLVALAHRKNSRVVTRIHADGFSKSTNARLKYLFDRIVEAHPIRSGYSREVDGELNFIDNDLALHSKFREVTPIPRIHFKLSEAGAKVASIHKES